MLTKVRGGGITFSEERTSVEPRGKAGELRLVQKR